MRRSLLGGLAVVLLLTGCSTRSDLQRMEETMVAEFREVNQRQDSLAREIRELRRTFLDSLEAREGETLGLQGELGRRLQEIQREIGRVAALAGQNQQVLQQIRERALAGGGGAAAAADTTGGAAGQADGVPDSAAAGGEEASGSTDPRRLYEAALQQFRRGSFGTARSGLREFLSQHPDHELAPDARFYVAETFARSDQPREALEQYSRVVELHPGSRRAAAALYKSGQLELDRGNVEDARVFFSRVVSGYPDSDEASLARERLQELGGDAGGGGS
jgi:tol-pal system protein YbgF